MTWEKGAICGLWIVVSGLIGMAGTVVFELPQSVGIVFMKVMAVGIVIALGAASWGITKGLWGKKR